jgi:hypothetical protein
MFSPVTCCFRYDFKDGIIAGIEIRRTYKMKKIIALAIGLGVVLGTVSFAAPQDKMEKTEKKKGGKKKKTEAPKPQL